MKALVLALLVVLTACKFDQKSFGDRVCTIDQDCDRPDLGCVNGTCAPRSCTTAADCGAGYSFSCTDLGCVAQSCTTNDGCGLGYVCNSDKLCQASFNVASARSTSNTTVDVTFDAPPDAATADTLSSYSISGLSLVGAPSLSGSTVTLTTSPQAATPYTVTVTNVTRAGDHVALGAATAVFDGRASFNVTSAVSTSAVNVLVTFDASPDPTSAGALASYSIPGLSITDAPQVNGNTVLLTTTQQGAQPYTLTVSGVRRMVDGEPLTTSTVMFGGRNSFDVGHAAAIHTNQVKVTFDAAPNAAQATNVANYSIPGLTLSGVPVLSGSDVLLTTSTQTAIGYTVTVSGVTRASDGEALTIASAGFSGINAFDVASAMSTNTHTVRVTFDAAPDPTAAVDPTNYDIQGLTIGGTPVLAGNTVTLTTSPQTASTYTVTVSNVSRASDAEPLTTNATQFMGRAPFDVSGVVSATSTRVIVSFDAPPDQTTATTLANYSIPGLTLSGTPQLAGNSVTISTSPQSSTDYTVTVANVTRAGDGEPLTVTSAGFTGRAPFDVSGAQATTTTTLVVTFDAAPNAGEATQPGNYNVPGLQLTGVPVLSGNQVTLTTTRQSNQSYAVIVTGVTRASDAEALTVASASFQGRAPFDVQSAASVSNVSMTVTFDAPPDPTAAVDVTHYDVPGLTLSSPVLGGNTVTFTTTTQSVQPYTVTVTGVPRASDGEALATNQAGFTGRTGFNVASASSVNTTTMSVTFDAPPNAQALVIGNYTVPGLVLSGTPSLSGSTVTITTSPQAAQTYTVTVNSANVQSASGSPLAVNQASFTHVAFNVTSAASVTSHSISVTFDAPPNAAQATTLGNYAVGGLTLSGTPSLSGNTVTINTSTQAAQSYTVVVSNVTRASDGSTLTTSSAQFTGRPPFDVTGAASTSSGSMTVTFSAPPNSAQATNLANYSVPGLTLKGTPLLSGSTVTLATSAQAAQSYTVTVTGVTRASDSEPLGTNNTSFAGTPLKTPTVTNVQVVSTVPDNGTRYYNTGSATVVITGTDFTGVTCPNGVQLADTNGNGTLINTKPTSCTVDSGTQITAVFGPGILTNGSLGWAVQVQNAVGRNATSTVNFVPYAGVLVSEVMEAASSVSTQHEFIELYNPTATALNLQTLPLHVHVRDTTDVDLALSFVHTTIPSHGFFLIVTTQSALESWYGSRDATYDGSLTDLVTNDGMYISLSAASQSKVLDKVGWGGQTAPFIETAAAGQLNSGNSIQRKPAGGAGAATDTDNNKNDFNNPSSAITPLGSSAPPQP